MSKQVHVWKTMDPPLTNTTEYVHPLQGSNVFSTEAIQGEHVSAPGTFSKLRVVVSAAPGVGKSWTVTLRVNGASTALTVTISGAATDATDSTNSVSVVAGDYIALQFTPSGTPAAMTPSVSITFDSTVPGTSVYGGSSQNTVSLTRFTALFGGNSGGNWLGNNSVNAVEGDLTRLDVSLDGDPVSGSYAFNIEKNGALQDGSGGTVNTTVTISGGSTTGSATFTLPCSPGDIFRLRVAPSTPGTVRRPRYGVALVADTPGDSNYQAEPSDNTDATATEYHSFGASGSPWDATEGNHQATVGEGFDLNYIEFALNLSPGNTRSYAITVRKNTADTALTASISNLNTSGNGTASVSFAPGDLINIKMVPTNTPTVRQACWAASMHIPDPATGRSYGYIF